MVPFLCVIVKNCVCPTNFFRYSANLYTFTSSKAASISSSIQNGDGFIFNIENNNAIAVNALSPPDNNIMFCSFLPGGCTFISIPVSRILLSSSSFSSAVPPPNSSLNVVLKFSFIILNCFRNCSFIVSVISAITSFSCAIEFSMSSLCSHMKSYLSDVFLYSSIESMFTLPMFLISSLILFASFVAFITLLGF